MSKVSVITTIYNGEKHISESVSSILNQSYKDFEVIALDDGSTDGTLSILKKFVDPRLRVITQGRIGRQKALNYAISTAKGKYIAILDADDVALPNRLKVEADYLDNNPDIGLVGAGLRMAINGDGDTLYEKDIGTYTDTEIREALCLGRNPLFHSSVMYRKELYSKVNGYDESLTCLLDMDFYVRLAAITKLENLHECLVYKRKHSAQYFKQGRIHGVLNAKKVRATIIYRTVRYLNAPKINLLKALKLYITA